MSLLVANWTDKQLDELTDLLRTADHSNVAAFIVENFLADGSRILSDRPATTLTVVEHTADKRMVDLKPGLFLHASKVSQIDATQTCAILGGTADWGVGEAAGDYSGNVGKNRWTIISVKNAEVTTTPEPRWFVDDSVSPNAYSEVSVNTKINKAFYDVIVTHGTYDPAVPPVPATPAGYWTIAEIWVPHDGNGTNAANSQVLLVDIYDTTDISNQTIPNWTSSSRIYRMEYYEEFYPGTRIPFYQASAPLNWTLVGGLNDKALRVVSGAGGGVGGSRGISEAAVGSHTLTIPEMPAHSHMVNAWWNQTGHGGGDVASAYSYWSQLTSGFAGGGGGHDHPLALAYIDVIVCSKN